MSITNYMLHKSTKFVGNSLKHTAGAARPAAVATALFSGSGAAEAEDGGIQALAATPSEASAEPGESTEQGVDGDVPRSASPAPSTGSRRSATSVASLAVASGTAEGSGGAGVAEGRSRFSWACTAAPLRTTRRQI